MISPQSGTGWGSVRSTIVSVFFKFSYTFDVYILTLLNRTTNDGTGEGREGEGEGGRERVGREEVYTDQKASFKTT